MVGTIGGGAARGGALFGEAATQPPRARKMTGRIVGDARQVRADITICAATNRQARLRFTCSSSRSAMAAKS